ncbi:helix-turn-helix domain-containing protein [Catenulispora sp. NL8]|uniref:Helix-turn-helix domain-containing protein n=2 Tax=Catenulispora pinistramenti TaxID=2705254 RepID=A0ABS5KIL7_9ACTN|nr:helix-turn-helix domain-containing protein [Catenulispora pinistramenti]
MMTTGELAEYLGLSTKTIYRNKHRLPTHRVGRGYRFRRSEIDRWLETCRENPGLL